MPKEATSMQLNFGMPMANSTEALHSALTQIPTDFSTTKTQRHQEILATEGTELTEKYQYFSTQRRKVAFILRSRVVTTENGKTAEKNLRSFDADSRTTRGNRHPATTPELSAD
jgi:hypothetical protein